MLLLTIHDLLLSDTGNADAKWKETLVMKACCNHFSCCADLSNVFAVFFACEGSSVAASATILGTKRKAGDDAGPL